MPPWIGPGRTMATWMMMSSKRCRLEAGQHLRLRPALHLERADGVAGGQHGVDAGIVQRQRRSVSGAWPVRSAISAHASLMASSVRRQSRSILISPASATVSLFHCATTTPCLGRVFQRHDLDQRLRGHQHPADVHREMARGVDELGGQRQHLVASLEAEVPGSVSDAWSGA